MKSDRQAQIEFFEWIRSQNRKDSLANTLSLLLDISRDSAYRRLRGDTLISFNELRQISHHYKISLDSYLRLTTSSVTFNNRSISDRFTFQNYLASLVANFEMLLSSKERSVTYLAKDIPIFYFFNFESLTRFKFYFWKKVILNDPELKSSRYHADLISDQLLKHATDIWRHFQKIPSLEIWSNETINVTISQINYAYESGFLTKIEAMRMAEELRNLIFHIRKQSETGHKYNCGTDPSVSLSSGKLVMYFNEVEIGDNTVLFKMDGQRVIFKAFNMLNTLSTSDDNFCDQIENHIDTMVQKSIPISMTSEKERSMFFNRMEAKVVALQNRM
ncbi:MAG: hypothetical protein RIA69_20825 [Cyclobacteriaceae bacterium]